MKIPFDIKFKPQIESGEYKVETRDGRQVRIICWDRKYGYPICGLAYVKASGCENYIVNAYKNGRTAIRGIQEMNDDLFLITPEPELSEFEKGYMRIVHKMKPEDFNDDGLKIAKEEAAGLLDLARKEIMDGWSNGLRDTQDQSGKAYSDGYKLGFEKGKAEALKEIEQDPESSYAFKRGVENGKRGLPRWIDDGLPIGSAAVDISGLCGFDFIRRRGRLFRISDLEKLPGFNE